MTVRHLHGAAVARDRAGAETVDGEEETHALAARGQDRSGGRVRGPEIVLEEMRRAVGAAGPAEHAEFERRGAGGGGAAGDARGGGQEQAVRGDEDVDRLRAQLRQEAERGVLLPAGVADMVRPVTQVRPGEEVERVAPRHHAQRRRDPRQRHGGGPGGRGVRPERREGMPRVAGFRAAPHTHQRGRARGEDGQVEILDAIRGRERGVDALRGEDAARRRVGRVSRAAAADQAGQQEERRKAAPWEGPGGPCGFRVRRRIHGWPRKR